uniref:Transcription repressor n=1 Tax=Kalanchoe fedtschenkoi TaxID=63787 RepID=A0A7N0TID4_KALFE
MSKKLQKSIQEYFSKIRKPDPNDHQLPQLNSFTSSVKHRKLSKMFSGCKHPPKTLSFSIDHNYTLPRHRRKEHCVDKEEEDEHGEASLSDIDNFLVENFKSLYGEKDEEDRDDNERSCPRYIEEDKNRLGDYLLQKSPKFFKDEPQQELSASTADGGGCSTDSTTSYVNKSSQQPVIMSASDKNAGVAECIIVMKRSSTLYEDFWQSMKELIDGRVDNGFVPDGGFLQEMLLCFLNLNEKKYYKHIVGAFMDLTADLTDKPIARKER